MIALSWAPHLVQNYITAAEKSVAESLRHLAWQSIVKRFTLIVWVDDKLNILIVYCHRLAPDIVQRTRLCGVPTPLVSIGDGVGDIYLWPERVNRCRWH